MFKFHLLAAAPPEEVSDETVKTALLQLKVGSIEEINELCGILERARPELFKKLEGYVKKLRQT